VTANAAGGRLTEANWITLAVLCRVDNAHGNDFPDQEQLSGFMKVLDTPHQKKRHDRT
jgi:hypothetical protein